MNGALDEALFSLLCVRDHNIRKILAGGIRAMGTSPCSVKPARRQAAEIAPLGNICGAAVLGGVSAGDGRGALHRFWMEECTATNFWSDRIWRKRSMARSRRRKGRWEFSARLLSHRPVSRLSLSRWSLSAVSTHGCLRVLFSTVDLQETLAEVPVGQGAHPVGTLAADLHGEHRPEVVPPEPHPLVPNVDAALLQQVLDVAQRELVADLGHYGQADDLGTGLERPKRGSAESCRQANRILVFSDSRMQCGPP